MKVTIQDNKTSVTVQPRDFKVTVSGARGPAGTAGANEWGEITGDIIDQTDLYNALEDKVPYTGATSDVNLGEHKLLFANASELREGTYDFGGQGGISQICSVGFENNWQSGFNHIFDNNGLIRESMHCFDVVPNSSFDSSLRFKIGSLWKLDDGTIYECVDATIGAAVWQLYNPYETDISGLVPYTGATADVNLGEYGAQLGNLEFDNTPTNVPTTAGSVYWNDTDGTLNMVLKGGQTISRIGETQHIRALNNTGAQIARGKVVYVVGAQGQRLTIALADADTEILSKDTIGFTAEAIADGAEGFVIVQGVINNISTTGMTDGATVYLSQTAGSYTTTPPADPAHLVILGFIVNGGSGGAGSIYVKVDNGYELEELHNTSDSAKTTPVGADALLLRDSADNNLWKRLTWTNALAGVKSHMDTFKSVAGGYASLDGSGKVPSNELPSYVDDVVEVANYAALPVTGETGKIYVTINTNKCYRWSGTVYVQVAQGVDTLTTTGTSGAATLVGSTLNIPQYQSVLTNPVTGTGTDGQVSYWSGTGTQTGSANLFWDATNNRLGVGLNTGLTARLHVRGSGTTSATTALLVQNSSATELLKVTDDGFVRLGSAGAGMYASTSGAVNMSGPNVAFQSLEVNNPNYNFTFRNPNGPQLYTSGTSGIVSIGVGYAPTSGTGVFNQLNLAPSINQTGGANGITRGLYVNPNLTAAADWRSIEFSNNTGWGLYGAGTAPNYLAGRLAIGTTVASSSNLVITRAITSNGANVIADTRIESGVTTVYGFRSRMFTATGTYTVSDAYHFSADITTPDTSSGFANQYGFIAQSSMTGATNNYGFYGNIASGTGRWNLYMNGTAANYLAGNTSIGTTTSSGRLTVRGETTTSASNGLLVEDSAGTDTFTVRNDGGYAFKGGTVGLAQTGYTTFTNLVTDRTCNANATTVEELADILGTLIEDLKTKGIIAA